MRRTPLTAMLTTAAILASTVAVAGCGGEQLCFLITTPTTSTPATTTPATTTTTTPAPHKHKSKPAY